MAVAGSSLLAAAPVWAQARAYPSQPIRLLVGFPPGGATDVLARLVAQRLGARLQQSIVVDNQAGASGMLATNTVAKARPDGYTLLFSSSTHAIYPALYAKVAFDPVTSFEPIGLVATTPYALVVHPSLPIHSMQDLLAYARANPGRLNYAGSSPGTAQHLGWELLKRMARVDMQYVPYKGSSELLPDLKAGRLQAAIDNVAVMRPHIEDGSLRAIAVTGKATSAVLPGVAPVAAAGADVADFEATGWFGVFAPTGVPADVVARLSQELAAVMKSEELRDRLLALGAQTQDGTASSLRQLLDREVRTWTPLIRSAGIQAS